MYIFFLIVTYAKGVSEEVKLVCVLVLTAPIGKRQRKSSKDVRCRGRTKGFVLNFERQVETNNRDCSSVWQLENLGNRNFHPIDDRGKLIDHSGSEYVDSSSTATECNLKKNCKA